MIGCPLHLFFLFLTRSFELEGALGFLQLACSLEAWRLCLRPEAGCAVACHLFVIQSSLLSILRNYILLPSCLSTITSIDIFFPGSTLRPRIRSSSAIAVIDHIMKGLLALTLLPLLATASPMIGVDTIHNDAAPVLSSSLSQEIPDSYIVVFKKDVSSSSAAGHHEWVQEKHHECAKAKRDLHKRSQTPMQVFDGIRHTFDIAGGLVGYSGHFDEDVIEKVRRHPDVSCICLLLSLCCHVIPGYQRPFK